MAHSSKKNETIKKFSDRWEQLPGPLGDQSFKDLRASQFVVSWLELATYIIRIDFSYLLYEEIILTN